MISASGPSPFLPQSSLPPPVAKCPRRDRELIGQMRGAQDGGHGGDTLRGAPDGLPRGLRCLCHGNGLAAGGDEGGFSLGIGGRE